MAHLFQKCFDQELERGQLVKYYQKKTTEASKMVENHAFSRSCAETFESGLRYRS